MQCFLYFFDGNISMKFRLFPTQDQATLEAPEKHRPEVVKKVFKNKIKIILFQLQKKWILNKLRKLTKLKTFLSMMLTIINQGISDINKWCRQFLIVLKLTDIFLDLPSSKKYNLKYYTASEKLFWSYPLCSFWFRDMLYVHFF